MGETFYSLHSRRSHEHSQDLTPYSAVSSFNLPQHCDSTLITPVSLTQSLALNTTVAGCDLDIKLSPSDISPTYEMFNLDDEFSESKYNPPMKYKHPSGVLHISTSDSSFPASPLVPSTPYWGSYGVSATPVSSRSDSSPSMNPSPVGPPLNTGGGLRSNGEPLRQTQAAAPEQFQNRRPSIQSVPLLIAPRVPSPSSRQATTPHLNPTSRQNSLQSMAAASGPPASSQSRFSQSRQTMPIRRRRKSPRHTHGSNIHLQGEMTDEERVLWRLTETDRLPWKEVALRFTAETGKDMKVAALQMRKKRLVERLRVWTPSDDRALSLAFQDQHKMKWDQIADKMMLHGCVEKWPKEKVQKRWQEMHSGNDGFGGGKYEEDSKSGILMGEDFCMDDWSDGINSLHGSENGTSAVSPITMNEARSRQPSDASSHHLQIQQQMMFEQQQNWGDGSS